MSEWASTLKIEQSKEVIQLLPLLNVATIGKLQLHIQSNLNYFSTEFFVIFL